jgi:hypothetical protein
MANDFQSPQHALLVNLALGETLAAQFNPTELEESMGVNYSRLTVPGLSHQVMQYVHTENVTYSFDLFFDATDYGTEGPDRITTSRNFLYAACHPKATPGRIVGAGAPELLFVWPNMISLVCLLTKLNFRYTRFNKLLMPTAYTATVTLEELRSSIVTMEDVSTFGTRRGAAGTDRANPTGD